MIHCLYNCYNKIKNILNPRQKWIKKHIEYNQWCDKVELIPKFLFGCVVHYVEEEKCFERINWKATKKHSEFADQLGECYEYIKEKRPLLVKQLDDAYSNMSTKSLCNEALSEVTRLEKDLDNLDKKHIIWIVKNKDFMWT